MGIGYAGAFLGGIVTLLSPCAAMLLPAFLASAFSTRSALIGRVTMLYLGMITMLVPMGVAAGFLGDFLNQWRFQLLTVVAALVVVLGLMQALAVPLPFMPKGGASVTGSSPLAIYMLGLAYGVAGACSGPILGSVLAVAALEGNAVYGGLLLALYALGMILPVAILALAWDSFAPARKVLRPRPLRVLGRDTTVGNLISGLLFVGLGGALLYTQGAAATGGIVSAEAQLQLEGWAARVGAGVSDHVILIGVALLMVLGAVVWLVRANRVSGKDEPSQED